jgi:hypothetical protein
MSWTKCHRKGRFFVLNDPNKSKNPTSEVPWFWPRFKNPLLVSESQSSHFCRTFRDAVWVLLWVPSSPDSAEVAEELPAESVSFNEKKQEGTLALPKTGLRISTWRCSGGARDGINSILYHLWTRFWLFKKGLKQTLRHMWYLSLSLSIAISTGETDPGSGASTAATQQMGQPKAWKKTLLSQLYRQAEIKERISKNTVATLTYADINYWMVLVWPSDFLACSWKPRSSTHVSQHWGH